MHDNYNYCNEDLFFQPDSDQNNDFTDKSNRNDSQHQQINKSINSLPYSQKNKYINGVNALQSIISGSKNGEDQGKSMDKRQRNKMAAKNSRDRKKLHIKAMEEKKKALQKQLQSKKRQLQQSKDYYQRIVSQSKTMSNFAQSRNLLIKRLQSLLESDQDDPTPQINQIIDNLRSRIGATGKQRINTINQYFRQIVNLSLPALHRYMMWSASEKKHLFAQDEQKQAQQQQWFRQLKNALNLTAEQKRQILSKQQFLGQQKKTLEGLIEQLREVKDQIENKSIQLDDIIDGIRKILTPVQCAHFILFIEKNKFRKQLNLCDPSNLQPSPTRKTGKKQ